MPKEPRGQKRPADVGGGAVHIGKIATGEIKLAPKLKQPANRRNSFVGTKSHQHNTIADERTVITCRAANARWK